MKLLDEIIGLLSSESASLTEALLKTKVLLHTIGRRELVEWVNYELNGYPEAETLPPYRTLRGQILANVNNAAWRAPAHPLPLGHLNDQQRENFETVPMHQSLAVLEKLVDGSTKGGELHFDLPLEANGFLGKNLGSGFRIERAWIRLPKTEVTGILIQVRSRLLDFVLGLKEKLDGDLSDQEAKTRIGEFDASRMFNSAIFGDNTTIVVGNQNKPQVSNIKTIVGDFSALASELRRHNITDEDISALKEAIARDEGESELKQQRFGPAVKVWMQKMWGKAMDALWTVDLGIVSGLLTTAIQKYYGWS
jgi:hypothetical protein